MDKNALRHHTSSVLWLGLAEATVRGGNVVLQFLLARALGRAPYGVFAYAYSFAMLVVPAGGIGLLEAFVRRGAGDEGVVPALSEFFPLRAVSAVVTAAVLVVFAFADGSNAEVVLAVGLFVLFRALTAFLASSFRAAQVVWKEFALRCGEAGVLLAVVFGAIRVRPGLVPVSLLLAVAAGLFFLLTLGTFRNVFPGFRWRWPRPWISSALRAAPLGLPALMGAFLLRTDVVLIQRLTSRAAVTADYAAAVNLVLGAGLVPATVSAALFPALSRRRGLLPFRPLVAGIAAFSALGGALALLLATQAPRIVRLAYGRGFDGAPAFAASLAPFLLFLAPTVFATTLLASRNAIAPLLLLAFVPLGAKVAVDLWALPARLAWVPRSSGSLEAAMFLATLGILALSRARSYTS